MFGTLLKAITGSPYFAYAKYIGIALLLALLVVQTIRVANRDTTIAEKQTEIVAWMSNCTAQETEIGLFQTDQKAANATITALQQQFNAQEAAIQRYRENIASQQALIAGTHSTPAAPKQEKGEVLDDESSTKVVIFLNDLFGRVGVLRD